MPRSSTTSATRHLAAVLLLALLAPLSVLAGPVLAEEGPQDTPPIIHYASVSPGALPNWGGVATVTVNAIDDFGIYQAYANVQLPDGGGLTVQLFPSGDTNYTGYFDIPANYGFQPVSYYVDVQVWDTNGGFDTDVAGRVDVEPQPPVNEPPTMSDPFVLPRELPSDGGTVTIGVTAYDLVNTTAYARVTDSEGGPSTYVDLTPTTWPKFEGRLYVPGNATSMVKTYSVEMTGVDDIGQSTSIDAGQFTVAAINPSRGPACSARHRRGRSLCAPAK
jgi:hypothetical protein